MKRKIDIINNPTQVNKWVYKSINLFQNTSYLDEILKVYPLKISFPDRLDDSIRRKIIMTHQSRSTGELLNLLEDLKKFPYDEPIWYLIKEVKDCYRNNPKQIQRIVDTLYSMTADETVARLESPPKLNTQMGTMFSDWIKLNFKSLSLDDFISSTKDIYILDSSEEKAKNFINKQLKQNLEKRPDLVAKVNKQYIIGEAKWIGQPGGNQGKQVLEVLNFCRKQVGQIVRVGIIDGFPWAIFNSKGNIINNKESVYVQESEYDIISALLLNDYLSEYL